MDGAVVGEKLGTPSLWLEVMAERDTWNSFSLGRLIKSTENGPLRLAVMVEGRNIELPLFVLWNVLYCYYIQLP